MAKNKLFFEIIVMIALCKLKKLKSLTFFIESYQSIEASDKLRQYRYKNQ